MNAPECVRCDDSGVVPGKREPDVAFCTCATGELLGNPYVKSGAIGGMRAEAFAGMTLGPISIDEQGMAYRGERIEDVGRAYRTLMAVMHNRDPNPRDLPHTLAPLDTRIQDLGLMVARMAHALELASPGNELILNADKILKRNGLLSGVDYKALDLPRQSKPWPVPGANGPFTTERRHDPHNMSNRHNPLNMGRRRSDRED